MSLVNKEELGTVIQGWVNAYVEGEWLPKWASPGYRGSMVGTMGDVSLAAAIVQDIPGFDREKAYEAIRKDAFEVPTSNLRGKGRVCLPAYLKYGYIPRDSASTEGGTCSEVVSRSLNYMQSDYAIAQAALKVGYTDDAAVLLARSANYSLLFDQESATPNAGKGFMRSKSVATQKWTEGFDQFAWGDDYTEGGPWQFRFYVPHDPAGLAQLYQSAGYDVCSVLDQMQTMNGVFHLGGYGTEIHEQLEMTENCWGQYAHGNQPVHHVLYMYNGVDPAGARGSCASRGQYWLRKVQQELYVYRPAMYAGDEDNGEMAAWYVLSTLGLFSLAPGSNQYLFGSPLFAHVDVIVDEAKQTVLSIRAVNNAADHPYIQSITWNNVDISSQNGIDYSKLMEGGVLEFTMGAAPYKQV